MLTAAHCTLPGAEYKLMEFDAAHQPVLRDVREIARHPQFELKTLLAHRATADVSCATLRPPQLNSASGYSGRTRCLDYV